MLVKYSLYYGLLILSSLVWGMVASLSGVPLAVTAIVGGIYGLLYSLAFRRYL